MYCLAISTSTKFLCVALLKDNKVIKEYNQVQETGHNRFLAPKISSVVSSCGLDLADLDCLAVDIGPGSFTGLRIGVATIKGLSLVLKKPIIAVSGLDLIAAGIAGENSLICPIIDAKRHNVYAALYKQKKTGIKRESRYLLLTIEELLKKIKFPAVLSGDAVKLYREKIEQTSKLKLIFAKEKSWYPSGTSFAKLCYGLYKSKKVLKAEQVTPLYLYPDTCTVRKRRSN